MWDNDDDIDVDVVDDNDDDVDVKDDVNDGVDDVVDVNDDTMTDGRAVGINEDVSMAVAQSITMAPCNIIYMTLYYMVTLTF